MERIREIGKGNPSERKDEGVAWRYMRVRM